MTPQEFQMLNQKLDLVLIGLSQQLTTEQAAKYIGVSPTYFKKLYTGPSPATPSTGRGRQRLFQKSDLDAWRANNKNKLKIVTV